MRDRAPAYRGPVLHFDTLYLVTLRGGGRIDETLATENAGGVLVTPPEETNTGPGLNRGSGGGARGCGFEERVGVHARTGGIQFT